LFRAFAKVLPLALVAAMAPVPPLSAQSIQSHTLSFRDDFTISSEGLIAYNIYAIVKTQRTVKTGSILLTPTLDPDDQWKPAFDFYVTETERRVDLLNVQDHVWYSPRGIFDSRSIASEQDALDKGAP
jgi:hypothetical protein